MTERARGEACRRVGQDGHSVAQVAAAFGVSWVTVMAAVREESESDARIDALLGMLDTTVWVGDLRRTYVEAANVAAVDLYEYLRIRAGQCLGEPGGAFGGVDSYAQGGAFSQGAQATSSLA